MNPPERLRRAAELIEQARTASSALEAQSLLTEAQVLADSVVGMLGELYARWKKSAPV